VPIITTRDVCERALFDLNVLAAGEVMGADDGVFLVNELNTLLDELNAERAAVWAELIRPYVLTSNLQPHTIGPTGTFVVAQRPQTVEGVAYGIGALRIALTLRDRQWVDALRTPATTGPQPRDVWYNPLWPNGALSFYPIPSAGGVIDITTRQILAELALTDTLSLPPGYRSFLQKTLAVRVAAAYEKPVPSRLERDAQKAEARVFAANSEIPRLHTADAGIPGASTGGRGGR
jgi:hypothetical protein